MIFDGVVKDSGDDHIFSDQDWAACLAHHQRCDSEQMSHVGDLGSLAGFRVERARIVNGAGKAVSEDEGLVWGISSFSIAWGKCRTTITVVGYFEVFDLRMKSGIVPRTKKAIQPSRKVSHIKAKIGSRTASGSLSKT